MLDMFAFDLKNMLIYCAVCDGFCWIDEIETAAK